MADVFDGGRFGGEPVSRFTGESCARVNTIGYTYLVVNCAHTDRRVHGQNSE
jgi:hypothetical protein